MRHNFLEGVKYSDAGHMVYQDERTTVLKNFDDKPTHYRHDRRESERFPLRASNQNPMLLPGNRRANIRLYSKPGWSSWDDTAPHSRPTWSSRSDIYPEPLWGRSVEGGRVFSPSVNSRISRPSLQEGFVGLIAVNIQ